MGVFEVPADKLIESMAKSLEQEYSIEKPAFIDYVKTGSHRERNPLRRDWFFVRMASLIYRLHTDGSNGVSSFRIYYGGRKNRGVKPHRFRRASGKVIRVALQSLEKAGLVEKADKGRKLSKKGHSFIVKKSKEIEKELKKHEKMQPVFEKPTEELSEKGSEQKPQEKSESQEKSEPQQKAEESVQSEQGQKEKVQGTQKEETHSQEQIGVQEQKSEKKKQMPDEAHEKKPQAESLNAAEGGDQK